MVLAGYRGIECPLGAPRSVKFTCIFYPSGLLGPTVTLLEIWVHHKGLQVLGVTQLSDEDRWVSA